MGADRRGMSGQRADLAQGTRVHTDCVRGIMKVCSRQTRRQFAGGLGASSGAE
jgi:hypothetical protein